MCEKQTDIHTYATHKHDFLYKKNSEEKIISATLDKYYAFIIVNLHCDSTSAQISYPLTVCL